MNQDKEHSLLEDVKILHASESAKCYRIVCALMLSFKGSKNVLIPE